MEYILIFVSAIFVNNIILSQFLGICPFLGVSRRIDTSLGMGAAVAFVMTLATIVTWLIQHYVEPLRRWVVSQPNLSFYSWAVSLSITTGITVKNIVHSQSSVLLLLLIAVATLVLCFVQFIIGRGIGRWLGETVNAGQALFQKNTGLSIWVAYMYLSPVASIGAGCYVLWQNIINSIEIWQYKQKG